MKKARLAVPMLLCAAMAGGPALALMHASAPPSSMPPHVLTGGNAVAVSASAPEPPAEATGGLETTTSTTATTTPATTPTTAVRTALHLAPATTVPRRTTTTVKAAVRPTAAPAKPAPKPAPAPGSSGSGSGTAAPAGRSQSGGATWYDAAPPGTCAHKTLPMGTVVTIHASNGHTAQCTVSDRGPYAEGMIIDLAKDVFEQLAPLSQGVVQVTITW